MRTRERCRSSSSCLIAGTLLATSALALPARAQQDATGDIVLELKYIPVARAQVAIWIEDAAGTFLATVALTEAVAFRGIGNRPGASQMNSGYRWPFGRREGVLPIWATRRAAAPGAKLFPRVVFQARSEGAGTRAILDQSPDTYFCLPFDMMKSTRDKLDAVSCATLFHSDKGRYLTADDVSAGYAEPFQALDLSSGALGRMQALPLQSLYPPRMDATRCTDENCYDSMDVDRFANDAREVMPEIDAITRATAQGDSEEAVLFSVPPAWPPGDYAAFIEVNVEGDYNERWNDQTYPTPIVPADDWDLYARFYGYPYRGQPSIVYAVPFTLGGDEGRTATGEPLGRSSWDYWSERYGQLEPISFASEDPAMISNADGSGADRLRVDDRGERFAVAVRYAPASAAIGAVSELSLRPVDDRLRTHTWAVLRLRVPSSERPLHGYQVRVATVPITDEASFIRDGRPARNATDSAEGATELKLPLDVSPGSAIETTLGDLAASTHYYVGVRATDELNRHGPIRVAEITTTERTFATVTPCFIASAAYGSALAPEVGVLRRVRDRYLATSAPGRALVRAYYALGPSAALQLQAHSTLRAYVQALLRPLVRAATWLLSA